MVEVFTCTAHTCLWVSVSASVFLAAGHLCFSLPAGPDADTGDDNLASEPRGGTNTRGEAKAGRRGLHSRRKRGVQCDGESNGLGDAGPLQEAKWPSVILHTSWLCSYPPPKRLKEEQTAQ